MMKDLVKRLQEKEEKMIEIRDTYMNIQNYHSKNQKHLNILLISIKTKIVKLKRMSVKMV